MSSTATFTYPPCITYPPPPPTINALTAEQRSHLVRSSKKLERVLGATPRFIDDENIEVMGPRSPHSSLSRSSSLKSVDLQRVDSRSSSRSLPSPNAIRTENSWRKSKRLPPLLRLALNSASRMPIVSDLSTIPESPSIPATNAGLSHVPSASSRRSSLHSVAHSPSLPAFKIHSDTSTRRDKMDRLRRKFGDDVPMDLVFPGEGQKSRKHQRSESVQVTIPGDAHLPRSPTHTVVIKATYPRKTSPAMSGKGSLKSIVEWEELDIESGEQQGLIRARRSHTRSSTIGSQDYVAHRRKKMNGHPVIEPVGFLSQRF